MGPTKIIFAASGRLVRSAASCGCHSLNPRAFLTHEARGTPTVASVYLEHGQSIYKVSRTFWLHTQVPRVHLRVQPYAITGK